MDTKMIPLGMVLVCFSLFLGYEIGYGQGQAAPNSPSSVVSAVPASTELSDAIQRQQQKIDELETNTTGLLNSLGTAQRDAAICEARLNGIQAAEDAAINARRLNEETGRAVERAIPYVLPHLLGH